MRDSRLLSQNIGQSAGNLDLYGSLIFTHCIIMLRCILPQYILDYDLFLFRSNSIRNINKFSASFISAQPDVYINVAADLGSFTKLLELKPSHHTS